MKIHPLDLIFVQGGEAVSKSIIYLTKRQQRRAKRKLAKEWYSHVALVVNNKLFDDPRLEEGKLYVLESTYTGKNDDGVRNIDNDPFLGVQIRPLDALIRAYTDPKKPDRKIAFSMLRNNPFARSDFRSLTEQSVMRVTFTAFCRHTWEHTRYDANPISLLASLYTPFRPLRTLVERFVNTDQWLFCSELVAEVARCLDILPVDINPKNVLPMDLVGYDKDHEADGGMPTRTIWETPVLIQRPQ